MKVAGPTVRMSVGDGQGPLGIPHLHNHQQAMVLFLRNRRRKSKRVQSAIRREFESKRDKKTLGARLLRPVRSTGWFVT